MVKNYEYITTEFIEWLQQRKTKVADKCLEVINKDNFQVVLYYGVYCYLTKTWSGAVIPDYVYQQLSLFLRDKDYEFLGGYIEK